MTNFLVLMPVALLLGLIGLAAFLWSIRANQYEDLDGAAHRILLDDDLDYEKANDTGDQSGKTSR